MVSTRTINREKKVKMLEDSLMIILKMLRWDKKDLEKVNMARFKELKLFLTEMEGIER